MIQLPDNWQQTARVKMFLNSPQAVLYLHMKNDANQYFSFMQVLDPAFSLDETLGMLNSRDWSDMQAYTLQEDLTDIYMEPSDQHWMPAPLFAPEMVSLAQYKVLKGLPNAT